MSTVTRIETEAHETEDGQRAPRWPGVEIAVMLPCFNEAATIADVIADVIAVFRRDLPEARIYVYDNNSTDDTASQAVPPAPGCAGSTSKARATWCGACSPTSTPTSICCPTAT